MFSVSFSSQSLLLFHVKQENAQQRSPLATNMAKWGNRSGRGNVSSEDLLDQENQRLTENLSNKVSRLKNIAFDMNEDVKDQNNYVLSGVDSEFDSGVGLLSGSMNRLNHMIGTSQSNKKLMCYLILGLVMVFIIFYYLVSWIRS